MKKRVISIIIIILLLSLFGCSFNTSKKVFNINPNTPSSNIKGPMWKIEDSNNTVYLYGTIHNASKEIYPLHKDVEDSFNESDFFVMEQNYLDLDKNALNKLCYYQNGDTMENHLSKEALTIVKKYAKKYNGGYSEAIKLKPFAYTRNMADILANNKNFDSRFGVDNYFFQKAQITNKPILSLDNFIEIYEDLGNISDECSNKIILQLDNINSDSGLKSLEKWKNANIESYEQNEDVSLQEYEDIILYNRNKKWVEKIIEYINDDKNYFVAAGSSHFEGDKSVINLLKEKGYTVSFLSN